MAMKSCRECGTDVSSEAPTCPKCGVKSPVKKRSVLKIVAIAFGGLFGLSICARVVSGPQKEGASTSSPTSAAAVAEAEAEPAPAFTVSAQKYLADYKANEVAADNVYKGKRFALTGRVKSIEKDILGKPRLDLQAGEMFEWVTATLRRSEETSAAALAKGQPITLHCSSGTMVATMVSATDCVIAR